MHPMLTRRTLLPLLAGGLLAPRIARADLAAIEAAARKEGAVTWYTAHTDGETAQMVANAFTQQYPEIKVTLIRTTAQVAYQRLLQDLKNGIAQCDVFSSTDLGHDEALKADGKFAKYLPQNAAALRPAFRDLDPGGTYFPTLSELVIPIYNTNKVKAADAPKSWPELLDPRWRNQVAVGHPAYSGTVGTWVVAMRKLYGWEYFEKLERNKPLIGRSVNDAVGVLNSGERIVAAGPSGLSQVTAAKGNPIGLNYPTDGAVLIVSPSAVMANAPHPNAARLFEEFLLGPINARVSAEVRRLPVREDYPVQPGEKPMAEIKITRLTTAEIVQGIPEVIEQWRDTFGS
jgi:iron(III) transport system substrate-binding protein